MHLSTCDSFTQSIHSHSNKSYSKVKKNLRGAFLFEIISGCSGATDFSKVARANRFMQLSSEGEEPRHRFRLGNRSCRKTSSSVVVVIVSYINSNSSSSHRRHVTFATFQRFSLCSSQNLLCQDRFLFSQHSPRPRSASACPSHVPVCMYRIAQFVSCVMNSVNSVLRVYVSAECAEAVRATHTLRQRQRHSVQSLCAHLILMPN